MPGFTAVTEYTDEKPKIRFNGYVDEYGDYVVEANGEKLLFIDSDDGILNLYKNGRMVPGLKFDSEGRIALWN